jgi:hypothetical protein
MVTAAGATGIFIVSTKTLLSLSGVVVALGLGFYVGFHRAVIAPLPPSPETPQQVRTLATLRKENQDLRAEIDRLKAANTELVQAKAPARPAPAAPRAVTPAVTNLAPLPALTKVNQQRAILNNLRMISAAIDQFYLENKRAPASIDEIVGPTKYIRALNPVAGESYASLQLEPKQVLTVMSPDGVGVTYDRFGNATTDLNAASRQAQAEAQLILIDRFGGEFVQRVSAAAQKAGAAYIASHGGKSPPNPEAALPYFDSAEAGADFLEFAAAAQALGMRM